MLVLSALCLVVLARYGRLRLAKSMYAPLAVLLVTYLVMRNQVLGVQFVESRLPIAILVLAISCIRPCPQGPVNVDGFFERRFLQPPLHHVAALATVQRPIFVPAIFANPSQQPMAVTSRYAAMYKFQDGDPPPVTSAAELATIIDQIRRLAVDASTPAVPPFLLVLYAVVFRILTGHDALP